MTVRAGRLRHRLEVVKLTSERDQYGSETEARESVGFFWCDAAEVDNSQLDKTLERDQTRIVFDTRYNKTLEAPTVSMFIIFRGREWDIVSVNNPRMLNERLVITCVQRG